MGNKLFQLAHEYVAEANVQKDQQSIEKARNAISSAYANSTDAEKVQLRELQASIDNLS